MATGTLYRATRNAHGDAVNGDGNSVRLGDADTEVGPIRVVIGGPAWRPVSGRGQVVDTQGQIGVAASETLQPKHGDLIIIDSVKYTVQGPPQWASREVVTTPPRYRWWTITATAN